MVVTWYAKEQILWEIMGHYKQVTPQKILRESIRVVSRAERER
jgi:hypothetical protein